MYQLDVKSAFNNGHLQEDKATPWIHCEKKVLRNEKGSLWPIASSKSLVQQGWFWFSQSRFQAELQWANIVYQKSTSEILILELYVDDPIVTGSPWWTTSISSFKQDMMSSFQMRDLGLMNDFNGMEAVLPLAFSSLKRNMPIICWRSSTCRIARLVVDHANALATLAPMISRRY